MTAPRPIPIIVLCGQSNANNADIIRAAFDRAAAVGGMVVHLAVNGSPLSASLDHGGGDWQAGSGADKGELLRALGAQLKSILDPASAAHVPGAVLSSVIWVHGGADIYSKAAAASYEANLAAMDRSLTAQFGAHDLVVAGMAEASLQHRNLTPALAHNWQLVHDAQQHLAATSPRIHYVDPDAVAAVGGYTAAQMFRWDYIHYSGSYGFAGAFGRALAAAALPVIPPGRHVDDAAYMAGTAGNNAFHWAVQGFGQVLAAAGYDSLTLTQARPVQVLATGAHNFRILSLGTAPAILDAISVETLRLGDGNDRAVMGGDLHYLNSGGGNDRVAGSAAADVILLGAGQDYAVGGAGNDRLWGMTGQDTLNGGAGADMLHGNAGSNLLTGGAGADQFYFDQGPGSDVVTDFTDQVDRLVLKGAAWADIHIRYGGGDAMVDVGQRHILLHDLAPASLSAADFILL